jgi:nucleoside-triphosphatase THEP1
MPRRIWQRIHVGQCPDQMVKNQVVIKRLTLVWALAETTLGGLLHAFKLPITGFLVGGFSVLIIGFLALYSGKNAWKTILQATTLVLLAKAGFSPQSPPTAYLAVAFQGLAGAMLFSTLPYRIAAPLFGFIALAESGLQRVLVLTLVFGTELWQALQTYAQSITTWFGLPAQISSVGLIVTYTLIHAFWGLATGIWLLHLPNQLERSRYMLHPLVTSTSKTQYRSRLTGFLSWGVLLVLTCAFVLQSPTAAGTLGCLLLRSFIVLILLFLVLRPIWQWCIHAWLHRQNSARKAELADFLKEILAARAEIEVIWLWAMQEPRAWLQCRAFISGILAWACLPVSNICILHGPIRSGKTTALQKWLVNKPETGGIITPDVQEQRVLTLLPEKITLPFQLDAQGLDTTVSVGRFHFSTATFEIARLQLETAAKSESKWVVVDEIGKLELKDQGFEPALSYLIAELKLQPHRKLLLVVRDELLQEVTTKYALHDAWRVTEISFS